MTDDQTVESMRVMPKVKALLADQGTTFANSFVSFPLCCPSRATFLTGQYSHNNGVRANRPPHGGYENFTDQATTFPVALQRAGYRTIHIGKYLNGYGAGSRRAEVPPGWTDWNGSIDPSTYRFLGYTLNENGRLHQFGNEESDYQTDVYARMASEVVRREAAEPGPFFLNVAFLAPHSEAPGASGANPSDGDINRAGGMNAPRAAARHRGYFANEPLPRPPSFDEADVSTKPAGIRRRPRLSEAKVAAITSSYRARLESLLSVDEALERIVVALRDSGELDRTVILFTSDNGFFHGEHRIPNGKELVYEPSVRVPLIIRGPGVPRGSVVRTLVANIDLAPTILELAGAEPLRPMDGRSLVPQLRPGPARWSRAILLENGVGGEPRYEGVRTAQYLYVTYGNGDRELYDMVADPDQLHNLLGDPQLATTRSALVDTLARLRDCAGATCH